mmetsp:Transcript_56401/g.120002  ORF Transcript_56401/g.120002 Transcript_56401/m.120002 type:complete len:442 (-) Transcript_56401:51-1376(-)|eukprot:CAMPEP_0206469250 /NCGR_PEP_ID=MMETSP0324_2-20121206/30159_1 /ASSEMBLY_ACC=CAM_ASM_000836 /TAXON_ID=2866 /ORGANISM="Crypthecodinium cohnii, Strain Seligo" /LENGTH=441 /DNA_ID=CAMNT_0053942955 /DNA_START=162 /DNA_END=1487 /DNA_ORIENTATION=-
MMTDLGIPGPVLVKEWVQQDFQRRLAQNVDAVEAALQALQSAQAHFGTAAAAAAAALPQNAPPAAAAVPASAPAVAPYGGSPGPGTSPSHSSSGYPTATPVASAPVAPIFRPSNPALGSSKYGPLCRGLAGPFQSVCIVGEPRYGKKLLVLDIDHTIYDPSTHEGSKGSVVSSKTFGFDESFVARCRPHLHNFLTEVHKEYDIMVWSASDMLRILMLLQQLGIVGGGHSDYSVVAVLDVESMSEMATKTSARSRHVGYVDGSNLVEAVTVPIGAIPGQQIEVQATDGQSMVVVVPPGLKAGDVFHVTLPHAVSSLSEEYGLDAADIQAALNLSLGRSGANGTESQQPIAPLPKARRKSGRVKPLSLIWACHEFSQFYTEQNTIIVDDTVDVCSANPSNSIQCSRYYWKNHATDDELPRLANYLLRIASQTSFPPSHESWRD